MRRNRAKLDSGFYVTGIEHVRRNFDEWQRVRIVVGAVPETLAEVTATKIAYLHLDMNCAPPEIAAAEHFWDRLSPGGVLLLDDYGYYGGPYAYGPAFGFYFGGGRHGHHHGHRGHHGGRHGHHGGHGGGRHR